MGASTCENMGEVVGSEGETWILAAFALPALRKLDKDQLKRGAGVGLVFGIAMSCWVRMCFVERALLCLGQSQ